MIKKNIIIFISIVVCISLISVGYLQYVQYNHLKESVGVAYLIINQYYYDLQRVGDSYGNLPTSLGINTMTYFSKVSSNIIEKYNNFEYNPAAFLSSFGYSGFNYYNNNDKEEIQTYREIVKYINDQMMVLNNHFEKKTGVFIPVVDNLKSREEVLRVYKNIYDELVYWSSTN